MNAIGARRQRDIEPIVDQHPRAVRPRRADGRAHEGAQLLRRKVSFANLNQLTAGLRRFADGGELFVPGGFITCLRIAAERLAVGDQIE